MGLLDHLHRPVVDHTPVDATTAPAAQHAEHRRRVTRPRGYRDTPTARARLAGVLDAQLPNGPWQVIAVGDRTLTVTDDPADPWIARPDPSTVALTADGVRSDKTMARALELLTAQGHGDPVALRPERRQVLMAHLTPAHREVRARVAHVLGMPPWALEVVPTWAVHPGHGGHLDRVEIRGVRSLARDADKRAAALLEVVGALPDGHPSWTVDDRGETVVLSWAPPLALPTTVSLAKVAALDGDADRIPIGIHPDGTAACWDAALSPHMLVAGGTGSGKSIAIAAIYAAALARGWQVVVGEAQKRGADYAPAAGRFSRLETAVEGVDGLVQSVYAEMERRGQMMVDAGVQKLAELPRAGRPRPILLILDEWQGLILEAKTSRGMSEALREAAERDSAHRGSIRYWTGKLLAEARSAEIHVLIATQEPSVENLGGSSIRAQLTTRLQMVPPATGLSRIQAAYAFPDTDDQDRALALVAQLGGRPGLGLIRGEVGGIRPLRSAYATLPEVGNYLDNLNLTPPPQLPDGTPAMLRNTGNGDGAPRARGTGRRGGAALDDALDAL